MTMLCSICGKGECDSEVIHIHHVVPQACGGKDGATVPLCSGHHNMIHVLAVKMATAIRNGKSVEFFWPEGHGKANVAKYLVGEIVKYTLQSKTKQYKVVIELDQLERDMLELLKQDHGVSSLKKAIYSSLNDSFRLRIR